jgi:hypothetical protein
MLLGTLPVIAELPIQIEPPDVPPPHRIVVPPPANTVTNSAVRASALPPLSPGATRLTVSLTDGSRLIGETKLKELALDSEALGALKVPLPNIREVKLGKDGAATLTLQNNDRLQAKWRLEKFDMQTSFGAISVPVQHVTGIQFSRETAEVRAP